MFIILIKHLKYLATLITKDKKLFFVIKEKKDSFLNINNNFINL
jgi:hypothetical protein